MINGKHGQETHRTKMGADKSAENTPNVAQNFGPICLPKPQNSGFSKKTLSLCVHSPWFATSHRIYNRTGRLFHYEELGDIIFQKLLAIHSKNQNCYKHLNKHVKINIMILFWFSKIEISWKLPKKGTLENFWTHFVILD